MFFTTCVCYFIFQGRNFVGKQTQYVIDRLENIKLFEILY